MTIRAQWRSGNAAVCKTAIRRFDSCLRLQSIWRPAQQCGDPRNCGAPEWVRKSLDLGSRLVRLTSAPVHHSYMASVTYGSADAPLSIAVAETREQAEHKAVKTAADRLLNMLNLDAELTVGG